MYGPAVTVQSDPEFQYSAAHHLSLAVRGGKGQVGGGLLRINTKGEAV
jgi:hypothetical protein